MLPKKLQLYQQHKDLGAKFADFNGWKMPIRYQSALSEHQIVREKCGVFDVSHMGRIFVSGKDCSRFLNHVLTTNILNLDLHRGSYTLFLNEKGQILEDALVYRLESGFLLCVNAGNKEKIHRHLAKESESFSEQITIQNLDCNSILLALQGPDSLKVLENVDRKLYETALSLPFMGVQKIPDGFLTRSGYTGEVGFEFFLQDLDFGSLFFQKLLEFGCIPIGLAARDTLRLEACMHLYGNDMTEETHPLEAGLGWTLDKSGENYIGRDACISIQQKGYQKRLCAFKMLEKSIPRHAMNVFEIDSKQQIGIVTSGGVLPTLDTYGGMVMIDRDVYATEKIVEVDIRGKRKKAVLQKRPLYKSRANPSKDLPLNKN